MNIAEQNKGRQFWILLVREFEKSNLTQKEFAALHHVNHNTFRRYLYQVRKNNPAVPNVVTASENQAIESLARRIRALESEKIKLAEEVATLHSAFNSFSSDFKASYEDFAARIRNEYFELATARALGKSEQEVLEFLAAATMQRIDNLISHRLADLGGRFDAPKIASVVQEIVRLTLEVEFRDQLALLDEKIMAKIGSEAAWPGRGGSAK